MMKKPHLEETQYALQLADGTTGNVLTTKGNVLNSKKEEEVYLVFNSIEEVYKKIKAVQSVNDKIEFNIYDSKYELIKYIPAPRWFK
jgi:hypothetical protein